MIGDIGTPQAAHDLLQDYYEGLPDEWLTDDTNALLGAIVLELQARRYQEDGPTDLSAYLDTQRQRRGTDRTDGTDPEYNELGPLDVTDSWAKQEWDFRAATVSIHNVSDTVLVAFRDPAKDKYRIRVDPADSPLVIGQVGTFGADRVHYKRPDSAQDSEIRVTAIKG